MKNADEEISALLMVLASSRMRRNRFLFVSRLPPELLARIFSFSAAIDPPSSSALGWITVTHVCSHWRQVALDHSTLWANVSLEIGSRWSDEMIQRAKLAPLIITPPRFFTQAVSEIAVRILHSHLGRTTELRLTSRKVFLPPMETFTASAPLLEEVCISSIHEYVRLPNDLFGHNAPRLRSACFRGCIIPWSSPLLRNLTHLDIALSSQGSNMDTAPNLPSHEEFFDLLANMCRLESLSIEEYFPRSLPEATASSRMRYPVIKLPHLSVLGLTGQWSDCAPVLRSIEVPATSRISLDCLDLDSNIFDSVLLPIVERHSGKTGEALPMRTLRIGIVSGLGYSFQIYLRYSNVVASLETLHAILQALHIQELSLLVLGFWTRAPKDFLAIFEPLKSAQRLEHIMYEDDACSLFPSTLAHTSVSESGPDNAHDQAIPFPRLRFIELWTNALGDGSALRYNGAAGRVGPVDKLVETLERREALGVPLERLEIHIDPSRTDPGYLDQLKAATQNTVIEVLDQ
ncbi:hypothetical protein HETIRDRAFT_473409 [Heterobasidion irregulare TC 32-1]|uniref:F-box domain-containing protein n=1 Tax=Heterobasidion irregulare (strain TC 32-1) TaxID=747525 RepID=W4KFR7_HETIT|nr:uncharacterized protein HETIRDRAFT_473409 [Heterobasidion irregulare TC 32-1]ETW84688.1 hypothetical protein HETIRDRAFT_473409 [Heterobasidion irregulare TC 32-1]